MSNKLSIPQRWRLPALLGVIAVALAGAAYINSNFLSSDSKLSTQPLKTEEAKEILGSCTFDQEVCEYIAAQTVAFQNGVTIESTIEGSASADGFNTTMKLDGTGNTEIISYQAGAIVGHLITVDQTMYMLDPQSNTWYTLGSAEDNSSDLGITNPADYIEEALNTETIVSMEFLGNEACGSSQCKKYQLFTEDLMEGENGEETEVFLWIDPSNSLLKEMLIVQNEEMVRMTYAYGGVTITQPESPVSFMQPESPMQGLDQLQGSGEGGEPTQAEIDAYIRELGF